MRYVKPICAVILASSSVVAWGNPITSPDQLGLKPANLVKVDFKEFRGKDKAVFGSSDIGQPYALVGLVLPSQMISAPPDLKPEDPVKIESTGVSRINNASYQSIAFTHPQRVVGFTVCSPKATSITITALDKNGRTLDETTLTEAKKPTYVGFVLENPEITVVRIVAPHATSMDAESDPASVSDISFGAASSGDSVAAGTIDISVGGGDLGLAHLVGSPGAGLSTLAFNGAGGGDAGVGGSGGAGSNAAGRNPGNRNPNLPPTTIPEPAAIAALSVGIAAFATRRRRR